MLSGPHAA
jgi:hypothetical protein